MAYNDYAKNVRDKLEKKIASKSYSKDSDGLPLNGVLLGLALTASIAGAASLNDDGENIKTTNEIMIQSEISKEKTNELSLVFFKHVEKFMTDETYNPNGSQKIKSIDYSHYNNGRVKYPNIAAKTVKEMMTNKDFEIAKKLNLSTKEADFINDIADNFAKEFYVRIKSAAKQRKHDAGLARVRETINNIEKSTLTWEKAVEIANRPVVQRD